MSTTIKSMVTDARGATLAASYERPTSRELHRKGIGQGNRSKIATGKSGIYTPAYAKDLPKLAAMLVDHPELEPVVRESCTPKQLKRLGLE